MFYSPFTDNDGNMLKIDKIKYSDLDQLKSKGITEGYKIEYKSAFDDSLKKNHLCKEITSFANSDGGWLFIGIKDDGEICNIDIDKRTDFDVTITNILKEKTSPVPKYEMKTLVCTNDSDRCVIVIYVPASKNTPFVCDGTIYVRNASSAIKANRSDIDELYFKRKEVLNWISNFCNHNYFDSFDKTFPFCYIYLFNPENEQKLKSYDLDELCNSDKPSNVSLINRSANSVIFYNANTTGCTSFFEYFDDHNVKFGIPMIPYRKYSNEMNKYFKEQLKLDIDSFSAIDGHVTLENISLLITNAFEMLNSYKKDIKDYSFIFEFQNVQNTFVVFEGQLREQFELFKDKGFRFCKKTNVISRDWQIIHLSDDTANYGYALTIASTIMGNTFGYTFEEFITLFANAQKKYSEENGTLSGSVTVAI